MGQINFKELILNKAKDLFPEILAIRCHLHSNPELSFQEFETSAYIAEKLKQNNISYKTQVSGTGIIAIIEGKNPNKSTLLLRGDMDALPIQEKNNVSYQSKKTGVMHACGHDVHSSCILGASIILNELREHFEGTIKIMFQPGEEMLPGGASLMIAEGVLENPKVEKALALHVFPNMEHGEVGFRKGMYMASSDELYVKVIGKGGHAAMTAEYNNPLLIAADFLQSVHQKFMLQKKLNEASEEIPTVIAFGKINGEGATNVIPECVLLEGTFRTMNENWRKQVHQELHLIAKQVSAKHNAKIELDIRVGYPFLINDEAFTEQCVNNASDFLGKEKVHELALRMAAEDFAFISQKVPSCFFRLGTGNKSKGITSGVHTSTFDIDERALETGTGLMAWLAFKTMQS